MTLLIDEYETQIVRELTSFDFSYHYRLVQNWHYEKDAIREMMVKMIHYLKLRKDLEHLAEVAQMMTFYSDDDEHGKITNDHLLYIIARCEWIFKRKPRSPNAMYI